MTPAEYRKLVNKLEKEIIFHAGEPTWQEKCEEIEEVKRQCNKKHGLIFLIK